MLQGLPDFLAMFFASKLLLVQFILAGLDGTMAWFVGVWDMECMMPILSCKIGMGCNSREYRPRMECKIGWDVSAWWGTRVQSPNQIGHS